MTKMVSVGQEPISGKDLHKKYRIPETKTVSELRESGREGKISRNLRYKEDRKVRHKLKMEAKRIIDGANEDDQD
jgi:hypothetical protein